MTVKELLDVLNDENTPVNAYLTAQYDYQRLPCTREAWGEEDERRYEAVKDRTILRIEPHVDEEGYDGSIFVSVILDLLLK